MINLLQDRVAFITGGNGNVGIGKAAALQMAKAGAKVVVIARSDDSGEATVKEVIDTGGKALFIKTDVSRAEDVEAAVAKTIAHFGKLDVF